MQILNKAFNFTANAVNASGELQNSFELKQYLQNKKCLLFFYPLNFTFVCPSELVLLAKLSEDFAAKNTKIVAVSVDSEFSHLEYRKYIERTTGHIINYPMVSDIKRNISQCYNVLSPKGMSCRGSFIINEEFNVVHFSVNDFAVGRNIKEYLRILDAIEHHKKNGEVCPADWNKGDKAMKPTQDGVEAFLRSQ